MKPKKFLALLPIAASLGMLFNLSSNNVLVSKAEGEVPVVSTSFSGDIEMKLGTLDSGYYVDSLFIPQYEKFIIKYDEKDYGYHCLDDDYSHLFYEQDEYICAYYDSTYSIFFYENPNPNDEDDLWRIRVVLEDPDLEAELWAEAFIDEDSGLECSETYDQAPNNWESFANSFAELSEEAKDIFIQALASNEPTASAIQKSAFMHDMCVAKYDFLVFMYNNSGSRQAFITNQSHNIDFNYSALIITIVSVVSVTTLLALIVFKKSKSRR